MRWMVEGGTHHDKRREIKEIREVIFYAGGGGFPVMICFFFFVNFMRFLY